MGVLSNAVQMAGAINARHFFPVIHWSLFMSETESLESILADDAAGQSGG